MAAVITNSQGDVVALTDSSEFAEYIDLDTVGIKNNLNSVIEHNFQAQDLDIFCAYELRWGWFDHVFASCPENKDLCTKCFNEREQYIAVIDPNIAGYSEHLALLRKCGLVD